MCVFYSRVCVDVDGFLRFFGFPRLSLSSINGRQDQPGNPSRWFGSFALITQQVSVLCYTFITYFASYLAVRYVIFNFLRK